MGLLGLFRKESKAILKPEIKTVRKVDSRGGAVVLSPDHNQLLVAGFKLWIVNPSSAKVVKEFAQEEPMYIKSAAFTVDGRGVIAGGETQDDRSPSMVLYDLNSGEILARSRDHSHSDYMMHKNILFSLDITADGKRVVSSGADGKLIVRDIETFEILRTIATPLCYGVAVSHDGRYAVSGGFIKGGPYLKSWDILNGTKVIDYTGHGDAVRSVAISPDNRHILSGGLDKTVKLWEFASGKCLHTLTGHADRVNCVAFCRGGSIGVSAGDDQVIRIWNLRNGECLTALDKQNGKILYLAVSPDGRFIVSSDDCREKTFIRELNWGDETEKKATQPKEQVKTPPSVPQAKSMRDSLSIACIKEITGLDFAVRDVAMTPAADMACAVGEYGEVAAWRVPEGERLYQKKLEGVSLRSVSFTPDGKRFVAAGEKILKLFESKSGAEIMNFDKNAKFNKSVAVINNGKFVVSATRDLGIRVWDIFSGACLNTFPIDLTNNLCDIAVTPDSRYGLIADGGVMVVDLHSGKFLHCLSSHPKARGHEDKVESVAIDAGGKTAVSTHARDLRVWDLTIFQCLKFFERSQPKDDWRLETGKERIQLWKRSLDEPGDYLCAMKAARDGKMAILAGETGKIYIFDLQKGDYALKQQGHQKRIKTLDCSDDFRFIITGSEDKTLRIWELKRNH